MTASNAQQHPARAHAYTKQQVTRVIRALIALQIVAGLANGSTIAIGSLLAADLGGEAMGGLGSTMMTVGAAVFAIPLARLVPTRGRRGSLGLGMVIGMLGALLAILASEARLFWLVLIAFVLVGAAMAVNFQARFAAADVSPIEHRGRNISLVVWSTTIGAVAGPNMLSLGAELGSALGLRAYSGTYIIVLIGQVVALAIILVALQIPKVPGAAEAAGSASAGTTATANPGTSRWSFLPGTVYPIAFIAVGHFVMIALMSMTAVHMHHHGAALTIIGITISLHIFGMYGLSPVFGTIADRAGRVVSAWVSIGLLGLATVLLIAFGGVEWIVVVALVALGLGWSAALVTSSAMLTDAVPAEHSTTYQGRSDLTMNIAGALGGVVAGPVVMGYGMAVLAAMSLVVVVVLAVFQLRYRPAATV